MLLKQMLYFVTVVDSHSFTEAAEKLFISQSAISQQIKLLENELGVSLLSRTGRRFSLTPAGEYFYGRSKSLLDEAEGIKRETTRIGEDRESLLRIGYLNLYNGLELQKVIAEFSSLYPEVTIKVFSGTHEELYTRIRDRELDLIVNDQRRVFSNEYENFILQNSPTFIELSTQNPLSKRDKIQIKELAYFPCILVSSPKQANTEESYYKETLGYSGNFIFARNLEDARLMALANSGFLSLEKVGTLPETPAGLKRIPMFKGEAAVKKNYCAFWRKDNAGYYIEEFATKLRELIRKSQADSFD